ncbi:MAG: Flp family type IVb pilin [Chloroflexia bacterium]|nr:Flp family type IVb pilin [Chloroflexia bacterium]
MARLRTSLRWIVDTADVEEGQGLVEYALIIGLVAVLCVAALTLMGGQASAMLSGLGKTL